MSLSFDRFRAVIEEELAERQAVPNPTAEQLAAIATLTTLLAGLPPEGVQ